MGGWVDGWGWVELVTQAMLSINESALWCRCRQEPSTINSSRLAGQSIHTGEPPDQRPQRPPTGQVSAQRVRERDAPQIQVPRLGSHHRRVACLVCWCRGADGGSDQRYGSGT